MPPSLSYAPPHLRHRRGVGTNKRIQCFRTKKFSKMTEAKVAEENVTSSSAASIEVTPATLVTASSIVGTSASVVPNSRHAMSMSTSAAVPVRTSGVVGPADAHGSAASTEKTLCKRCGGTDHVDARSALCPARRSGGSIRVSSAVSGAGGNRASLAGVRLQLGGAKKATKNLAPNWIKPWQVNEPPTEYEVMHRADFQSAVENDRAKQYLQELVARLKWTVCHGRNVTAVKIFEHLFEEPLGILRTRVQKRMRMEDENAPSIPAWKMWSLFAMHMWDARTQHSTDFEMQHLSMHLDKVNPEARDCLLPRTELQGLLNHLGLTEPSSGVVAGTTFTYSLDPAPQYQQFIRTVLRPSGKLFASGLNATLTKDDWHVGSRSKALYKKSKLDKAEPWGFTMDTIANSFKLVIAARLQEKFFRQDRATEELAEEVQNQTGHGASREDLIVTADQGFSKGHEWRTWASIGVGYCGVVNASFLHEHPLVGSSTRFAEKLPTNFRVPEGEALGDLIVTATHRQGLEGLDALAFAVRQHKRKTLRKRTTGKAREALVQTLRVMTTGAAAVEARRLRLDRLFVMYRQSVPNRPFVVANTLFYPRLPTDPSRPRDAETIEHALREVVVVWTASQRDALWHVLRRMLITGTGGHKIALLDAGALTLLRSPAEIARMKPLPGDKEALDATAIAIMRQSWFSRAFSTKAMAAGTHNELAVMAALRNAPHVRSIFDIGLVALKSHPYIGVSADGVAFVYPPIIVPGVDARGANGSRRTFVGGSDGAEDSNLFAGSGSSGTTEDVELDGGDSDSNSSDGGTYSDDNSVHEVSDDGGLCSEEEDGLARDEEGRWQSPPPAPATQALRTQTPTARKRYHLSSSEDEAADDATSAVTRSGSKSTLCCCCDKDIGTFANHCCHRCQRPMHNLCGHRREIGEEWVHWCNVCFADPGGGPVNRAWRGRRRMDVLSNNDAPPQHRSRACMDAEVRNFTFSWKLNVLHRPSSNHFSDYGLRHRYR